MRGSIVARGKGTWAVVIELPRGEDGKRRQKWHTVKGTKKAAEAELARLIHERHTGAYVEPSQETVASHLRRWLAMVKSNLGPSAYDLYEGYVSKHLVPRFGTLRLDRLTPAMVADYYVWLAAHGHRRTGGPLSSQVVHSIARTLRRALDVAVELGLLATNPARRVRMPQARNRKPDALTEERLTRVLAAVEGTHLHAITVVAVATGARRGELLALQWGDVDLDARVLTIHRSLEESSAGLRLKEPKSKAGNRTLALSAFAVKALRRVKAEQAERRLQFGADYLDDYVFAQADGSRWRPDLVSQQFRAHMRRAGITDVSLHTLRHSYGSYLLAGGVPVNAVSSAMGHSNATMTLNRYAHLLGGEQEQAAAVIEAAVGRVMGG